MKTALTVTLLTLCLVSAASFAQTPAQDANTVAADKDMILNTKEAVQADRTQLQADQVSNRDAVQADTDRLIADEQAHTAAVEKLKNDKQLLKIDDENFNGDGKPTGSMSDSN